MEAQRVKILPTKFSRSTGEKLPTSQVAWRDSTHKYPASVAAPALPGMRMKNSLRGQTNFNVETLIVVTLHIRN